VDVPVFHLDGLNNRMLIAIIAITHVVINHGMAVGGIPLVAYLEHRAHQSGDAAWDDLARRVLTFFFVITTTVGALTGVGIWFSAALVNPYAIGSLLRVFFWAWFTEWLVFVTEVALILAYYLTWKRWTGAKKRAHLRLGVALSLASWATMAIIVAILGFMMDPGSWRSDKTLLSGFLNPLYLPQLAFRTPLALLMAGAMGWLALLWTTERSSTLRPLAVRALSRWMLVWVVPCVLGGLWYARSVPPAMRPNLPVALLTQALERWADSALWVLAGAALVIVLLALVGNRRPAAIRGALLVVPVLLSVALLGAFERVREFVRKPYAIAGYLYSNGIRVDDYALLQRDGVLAHATYTAVRTITPENQAQAGREVFNLACTRCHTVDGVNGVRDILFRMYGPGAAWDAGAIEAYIGGMHQIRPFMPPFPGNEAEKRALAAYLTGLQASSDSIPGAETTGASAPPRPHRVGGGLLDLSGAVAAQAR
jgi:hypothetical protein